MTETIIQGEIDLTYKKDSYVEFPYHKMIPAPWNTAVKVFNYFIDGEMGNDSNDGKSWATAKKTIAAALAELPPDLFGHEAYFHVHPGTYEEPINIAGVNNGMVQFWNANLAYNDLAVNGDVFVNPDRNPNAVRSNDPIIIAPPTGFALWGGWSVNRDLSFHLRSAWGQYNSSCKLMWGRWVFKSTNDYCVALWNLKYVKIENLVCDMSAMTNVNILGALSITGDYTDIFIHSLGVVNTPSNLVNSNSSTFDWAGAITIGSKYGTVRTERYWWGNSNVATNFHPSFLPPANKKIHVEGWYQIYSAVGVWGPANLIDPYSLSWVQGHVDKGSKPRLRLNQDFGGQLVYKSAEADLLDNSTIAHIVKDETTSLTKQYISPKTREDGNFHVTKVPTTAIADANLNNGEVSFSLDETNGKLKIKVKKSNGTVMNGEVTLT